MACIDSLGFLNEEEEKNVGNPTENLNDSIDAFSSCSSDTENYDTDSEGISKSNEEFFYGKDNVTEWKKSPINPKKPLPSEEIQHVNRDQTSNSPLDIFYKFITKEMIESIVDYTNQYISTLQDNHEATPTSLAEINGLLGLLFLFRRKTDVPMEWFWKKDHTLCYTITKSAMTMERFFFLLECLRFDSISVEDNDDKIASIRKFLEAFSTNCHQMYTQGPYLTIDKKRLPFSGSHRNSKNYIKYVKLFALCDTKTMYTVNLDVYTKKQLDDRPQTCYSPENIVKRLCEPIKASKCNLILGRWFTSVSLVDFLVKEYSFGVVGGINGSEKEVPRPFLFNDARKKYSSVFGFQESMSLVSYVSKLEDAATIVLSTLHSTNELVKQRPKRKVPKIVEFYYSRCQTVDELVEKCSARSVSLMTKCLPLCVFFELMNFAAVNSCVLNKEANPEAREDHECYFLHKIGKGLLKEHVAEMTMLRNIPNPFDEPEEYSDEGDFDISSSSESDGFEAMFSTDEDD